MAKEPTKAPETYQSPLDIPAPPRKYDTIKVGNIEVNEQLFAEANVRDAQRIVNNLRTDQKLVRDLHGISHVITECCGKERFGNFCANCGRKLTEDPLVELLLYCRGRLEVLEKEHVGYGLWSRWIKALEQAIKK